MGVQARALHRAAWLRVRASTLRIALVSASITNAWIQTVAVAPDAYTLSAPVADAGDPGCLDVGGFGSDIPVLLAGHAVGGI